MNAETRPNLDWYQRYHFGEDKERRVVQRFTTKPSRSIFAPKEPGDPLIPGEWRQVLSCHPNEKLPGRKGRLELATGDFSAIRFRTSDCVMCMDVEDVYLDVQGNIVVEQEWASRPSAVFAPAHKVKRKKLPVPPHPELTRYLDVPYVVDQYDYSNATIHWVREVEKWPDPNRWANEEDALVKSFCGKTGWVRPRNMQPALRDYNHCHRCENLAAREVGE